MKKLLLVLMFYSHQLFAAPTEVIDYAKDTGKEEVENLCRNLSQKQDYSQLEVVLKKYDNETSKDKSGAAQATNCFNGIENKQNIVQNWQKNYPKSIYPTLLKQANLVSEFFKLRGTNYISNTDQDQLRQAFDFLEKGAADLDSSKKLGVSPLWYQSRIQVAFLQPDKRIFFYYLNEAVKKYPNYVPIYSIASQNMLPKWGFSYEDLESFARLGMQSSELKEEVYTSIYKSVVSPCCSKEIIAAGYFNKETFRKGAYAILKKYPTDYNYNRYAQYACLLGDIDTAKDIYNNKMKALIKSVWFKDSYNECLNKIKN